MSVLTKIREIYLAQQAKEEEHDVVVVANLRRGGSAHGKGNPTGSAVGKCTAQLQMLRYPEITKPEPFPLRSKIVMEGGHLLEAWWASAIEAAFPNKSGRVNELFYFPVPLDGKDVTALLKKVPEPFRKRKPGQFWGEVDLNFKPPTIGGTTEAPTLKNQIPRDPRSLKAREAKLKALPANLYQEAKRVAQDQNIPMTTMDMALGIPLLKPQPLGFILNPVDKLIWVPTYVDRILKHPDHGPVVLEKKAVSNYAFRKAVVGEVDFEKRTQMVTFVEATKMPVAWLFYRKETAHLLEIFFAPSNDHVKVTYTRSNGVQETFIRQGDKLVPQKAEPADVVDLDYFPESEWDVAETWTPYDSGLLDQIHDNVRRVLLAEPDQWQRRYGPSFVCPVCDGTGTQTLNKTNREPLKTPKPCETCKKTGVVNRVQLPNFPCGYCPVIHACWDKAGLELEVTDKPKYFVTKEAFEKSGITFEPFKTDGDEPEGID